MRNAVVTHPSTNHARRRATMLVEIKALPLSQAAMWLVGKVWYNRWERLVHEIVVCQVGLLTRCYCGSKWQWEAVDVDRWTVSLCLWRSGWKPRYYSGYGSRPPVAMELCHRPTCRRMLPTSVWVDSTLMVLSQGQSVRLVIIIIIIIWWQLLRRRNAATDTRAPYITILKQFM